MTATTDAFKQILWLFRVDNPNTYTSLDDPNFFKAIKELSVVQVKSPTNPYAGTATKVIRDLKRERRPKGFMDQLRKHMAATIIMAAGHRYPTNHAPKLHHWIPICYLGRFTRGLEQTKARGAHIPMIDFTAPEKHLITNDRAFAHVVKDKKGFFQLNSEYFFSVVEARYENAASRLTEKSTPERSHLQAFAAMLMVQHVRAPRGGDFQNRDLHEFAGAMATLMDSIESAFPYVEFTEKAFPFTPEAPTRERRFVDGSRAWHFPISSQATFILSEKELTKAERVRMAEGSRISTLKTAKRNGTPLYGALETDYPETCSGE